MWAHAWRGLAAAAVFVGLCVIFGEDEPRPAAAGGKAVSLSGDFGLVATLNFADDGETLLSTSWDKTVRVWNVAALPTDLGAEVTGLSALGLPYDVAMSPDGRAVVVAGAAGVAFWDWRAEGAKPEILTEPGPSRSLVFTPDGGSLIVGGLDGAIRVVDCRSKRVMASFGGSSDVVRGLWITPDGSALISLGYSGDLKFWDWRSKRAIRMIDGSTRTVLGVDLSPDGKTLALSRYWRTPGEVELWDLETGRLRTRCRGHEGVTHALAFSRDGETLASTGGDLKIRFWNVATGRAVGEVDNAGEWVRTLKFSVDGRWLAYTGACDRVQLKRIEAPGLAARPAPPAGSGA